MQVSEILDFLESDPEAAAEFSKHYVKATDHDTLKKAQAGSDRTVTELKKQIEELRAQSPDRDVMFSAGLADLAARDRILKLKEKAIDYALENEIPVKLAVRAVEDDEEKTFNNLDEYKKHLSGIIDDSFKKGITEGAKVREAKPGGGTDVRSWTPGNINSLSVAEQSRLFREDPSFRAAFRGAK